MPIPTLSSTSAAGSIPAPAPWRIFTSAWAATCSGPAKPHPVAYATAHAEAERIRGATVARERILVIGDALRTDLAAAENAGIDALFIAAGIHRAETMDGEGLSSEKLASFFTPGKPRALAAMPILAW